MTLFFLSVEKMLVSLNIHLANSLDPPIRIRAIIQLIKITDLEIPSK